MLAARRSRPALHPQESRMPLLRTGDLDLYHQVVGEGDPLVLVHGSWSDHTSWQPAIEADLRASFRVVTYDRRGHGKSEAGPGQGTRRQDEDDLEALIERLGPASAHVAGSSFGGSIALGLAARSSRSCSAASRSTSPRSSRSWPTTRTRWDNCARRKPRWTPYSPISARASTGRAHGSSWRRSPWDPAPGTGCPPPCARRSCTTRPPGWTSSPTPTGRRSIPTPSPGAPHRYCSAEAPRALCGWRRSSTGWPWPCHGCGGRPSKGRDTFPTSPIRGGTSPPSPASSGRPEARAPPLVGTVGSDRRSLFAPGSPTGRRSEGGRVS
ncbi:alpha/beta fold hydrolase [Streptomyces sp. S1D4-11]